MRPLLVVAVLLAPVTVAAQSWPDVVEHMDRSVVRVLNGDGADVGYCAGVVVNAEAGHVLTAAHCVPEKVSLTVDGRHADLVRINRVLDLAVLKAKLKSATALTIADVPKTAMPIAVVGYPFGSESIVVQLGSVASAETRDGEVWLNIDVLPGDSGGAVIDGTGKLVALAVGFRQSMAAHIGRAVPAHTLRAFLEDLPAGAK